MKRLKYLDDLTRLHKNGPGAIALLGPRQCGKTTLARQFAKEVSTETHFFDLEDPTDLARLSQPKLALESLKGLVVIDEIQRRPDLFPLLRVLLDRRPVRTRFLILGSASPELLRQSSESLAGRISFVELSPFSVLEVGGAETQREKLWLRGGFPRSYLAKSGPESAKWRQDYISTFLERDIPQLGIKIPSQQLRRFWIMLSHYHGQNWNASEISRSFGVSDTTMRHYLDILTSTFMVRQLQPWFVNIGKRLVKAPKIYIRDSGILHTLLGVKAVEEVRTHPKLGASWEGFALESIIQARRMKAEECFYWGVHEQSELDLFVPDLRRPVGFEVKYTDQPTVTSSMRAAIRDLNLKTLYVIYPGTQSFPLDKGIEVLSLKDACLI